MFEPVICVTCGLCIGHLIPLFEAMKEERYKEAYGDLLPDPVFMTLLNVEVELGEILDALNLTEWCCRRTILTYAPFRDYY